MHACEALRTDNLAARDAVHQQGVSRSANGGKRQHGSAHVSTHAISRRSARNGRAAPTRSGRKGVGESRRLACSSRHSRGNDWSRQPSFGNPRSLAWKAAKSWRMRVADTRPIRAKPARRSATLTLKGLCREHEMEYSECGRRPVTLGVTYAMGDNSHGGTNGHAPADSPRARTNDLPIAAAASNEIRSLIYLASDIGRPCRADAARSVAFQTWSR